MKSEILAATAVAAVSAFPAVAAAQEVGTVSVAANTDVSTPDRPTASLLNDSRPAMRAMLNAKLNRLVGNEGNPSAGFQLADYLVGWSSYGLVVKSPQPKLASLDSDDLKSLTSNRELNQKIASGSATFRDLIETVGELGLDQKAGSVRLGKDGTAFI